MGASQRLKGAQYERDVANRIRAALCYFADWSLAEAEREVKRSAQMQASKGDDMPDVLTPNPWYVECKKGTPAKYPHKAMDKVEKEAAVHNRFPVVFFMEDRKVEQVMCYLDHLLVACGSRPSEGFHKRIIMPADDFYSMFGMMFPKRTGI